MNIAIIANQTVINAAVFENIETAHTFLAAGVWPDADAVVELPDGYGIGDSYNGSAWVKAPEPEPEPELEPNPEPTSEERLDTLETTTDDIILMMAELIGGK